MEQEILIGIEMGKIPRVNRNISPPPSAEFVVHFQWFVGGKVLLSGDGVSGAIV